MNIYAVNFLARRRYHHWTLKQYIIIGIILVLEIILSCILEKIFPKADKKMLEIVSLVISAIVVLIFYITLL